MNKKFRLSKRFLKDIFQHCSEMNDLIDLARSKKLTNEQREALLQYLDVILELIDDIHDRVWNAWSDLESRDA